MIRRLAAVALAALLLGNAAPQVQVTGGVVEGKSEGGLIEFVGLPFAAPPTGELRWRAPRPVPGWTGVRNAARPAPACLQNDQGWNRADYVFASEDCLTLDVGTTSLAGKRPVIVWIHGGSNRAGSPGGMHRSGLVRRGVVMVAVRYRLGLFGFLSHRAFAAEAGAASGNYGLMDQMAALRWVRNNIANFGGDPDNITIAGESAGSQDVSLLLAAPAARTLFHKAAMESGTPGFGMPSRPLPDALAIGDQLKTILGVDSAEDLRSASPNALLAADLALTDPVLASNSYMWLRTTLDGAVLPAEPAMLLRQGPARPVIVGSNAFELDLPGGPDQRDLFLRTSFGPNAAAARAFYRLDQPEPPPHPRLGTRDQIIATDATFRCPAGRMATLLAESGAPVWRYEFDHPPTVLTRHAGEIGYIFWEDRIGSLHLQDYWLNFARTGNPNGTGLPAWPGYTARQRRHVLFDARGVTPGARLREDICRLQENL